MSEVLLRLLDDLWSEWALLSSPSSVAGGASDVNKSEMRLILNGPVAKFCLSFLTDTIFTLVHTSCSGSLKVRTIKSDHTVLKH